MSDMPYPERVRHSCCALQDVAPGRHRSLALPADSFILLWQYSVLIRGFQARGHGPASLAWAVRRAASVAAVPTAKAPAWASRMNTACFAASLNFDDASLNGPGGMQWFGLALQFGSERPEDQRVFQLVDGFCNSTQLDQL